jgi:hypothetical protein
MVIITYSIAKVADVITVVVDGGEALITIAMMVCILIAQQLKATSND